MTLPKVVNNVKYFKEVLTVALLLTIVFVVLIWKEEKLYSLGVTKVGENTFQRSHYGGQTKCEISFWTQEFPDVEFIIKSCDIDLFKKIENEEKIQIITKIKFTEIKTYRYIYIEGFKSKNFYFPITSFNDKLYDTIVLVCVVLLFSFTILYISNKRMNNENEGL